MQCVQSFPFKMTYWAVVSVFKDSSAKFQYYFYKCKEFLRKKSFSRSFQGLSSFSRPVRTMYITFCDFFLSLWVQMYLKYCSQ